MFFILLWARRIEDKSACLCRAALAHWHCASGYANSDGRMGPPHMANISPFPPITPPWLEQGRESSANRARYAHIRAAAPAGGGANLWPSAFPSSRHEGARSARFIRWIPAFAGMARWGHGSGGVGFIRWMPIGFLHGLESRNPAQIQRGTRTLQRRTACRSLTRSAKRALSMRDSGFRRNDEMGTWEWRSRLYSLDAHRVSAQTGRRESRANTARNAHIRAMAAAGDGASLWLSAAPSLRPEGARSARFLCGIPAFAGMTWWGHGNGGVGFIHWMPIGFLHRLFRRNDVAKGRNGGSYASLPP